MASQPGASHTSVMNRIRALPDNTTPIFIIQLFIVYCFPGIVDQANHFFLAVHQNDITLLASMIKLCTNQEADFLQALTTQLILDPNHLLSALITDFRSTLSLLMRGMKAIANELPSGFVTPSADNKELTVAQKSKMSANNGKCQISGWLCRSVIEACHIMPRAVCGQSEQNIHPLWDLLTVLFGNTQLTNDFVS